MNETPFSTALASAYRTVWTNAASRMLLIPGLPGIAACRDLQEDHAHLYEAVREGRWRRKFGLGPYARMVAPRGAKARDYVTQTFAQTRFLRAEGKEWFGHVQTALADAEQPFRVAIVNLDNMAPETFLAGIAGLPEEFCRDNRSGVMRVAAQTLSQVVRTRCRRTVFLYPCCDTAFLVEFKAAMGTAYQEFSALVDSQ